MNNIKKTLKSPLNVKNIGDPCNVKCPHCGEPATEMFRLELKAQIAGEAQKSLAREVLESICLIDFRVKELNYYFNKIEKLMKEILK